MKNSNISLLYLGSNGMFIMRATYGLQISMNIERKNRVSTMLNPWENELPERSQKHFYPLLLLLL